MRIVVILVVLFLTQSVDIASAQVGGGINDITGQNVNIILNPQYPNPGEQVTATLDDYSLNTSGATIAWFFDDLSVPAVDNNRTITFTAPEVSTPMKIVARLRFRDGKTLDAVRIISPLYLDLIIEPQTYTPVFYKGRALPTKGSLVNINALLQDKNGPVNSVDYSYSWTLNNKSVYGGARVGGHWAQIQIPHGQSNIVIITVQNSKGVTVARKLLAVPTADLDVRFYEKSSLLGLSQRSIQDDLIITGNSVSVRAVPYYLDTRSVNNNLFTEWSINTLPVQTETADPFEINLERGVAGTAQVSFKLRNLSELLQSDEESFRIKL